MPPKVGEVSLNELLSHILEELSDDQFKKFKWYLQIRGIPKSELEKADRLETVDKILQTHNQQSTEVMIEILRKIPRNDLVEKLLHNSHTGEEGFEGGPLQDSVPAQDSVPGLNLVFRTQFVDRVSNPVLDQILDILLERGVINDGEKETLKNPSNPKTRADKAREVFDTVQRKGPYASSVLLEALRKKDSVLFKELSKFIN